MVYRIVGSAGHCFGALASNRPNQPSLQWLEWTRRKGARRHPDAVIFLEHRYAPQPVRRLASGSALTRRVI
jgi:hypothetical protein